MKYDGGNDNVLKYALTLTAWNGMWAGVMAISWILMLIKTEPPSLCNTLSCFNSKSWTRWRATAPTVIVGNRLWGGGQCGAPLGSFMRLFSFSFLNVCWLRFFSSQTIAVMHRGAPAWSKQLHLHPSSAKRQSTLGKWRPASTCSRVLAEKKR